MEEKLGRRIIDVPIQNAHFAIRRMKTPTGSQLKLAMQVDRHAGEPDFVTLNDPLQVIISLLKNAKVHTLSQDHNAIETNLTHFEDNVLPQRIESSIGPYR